MAIIELKSVENTSNQNQLLALNQLLRDYSNDSKRLNDLKYESIIFLNSSPNQAYEYNLADLFGNLNKKELNFLDFNENFLRDIFYNNISYINRQIENSNFYRKFCNYVKFVYKN